MPHALILADDLTGAADTGAQFARRGWRTLLALQPGATTGEADVLVLSTETRGLPTGAQAAAVVSAALAELDASLPLSDFLLVYKKIDSTLRGYPAAELAALLAALGESRTLIAPAFPAQGRTTRGGQVFVQGVPLAQTSFSGGPYSGNLHLRFGKTARPALLSLEGVRGGLMAIRITLEQFPGVWIADAENDEDLRHVVQAGLAVGWRVLCGSAGLAAALADALSDNLSVGSPDAAASQPPRGLSGALLVVAGSRHPITAAQLRAACRGGAVLLQPAPDFYDDPGPIGIAKTAAQLAAALAHTGPVMLASDPAAPGLSPAAVAHKLGLVAALALENVTPAGLVLTGGDTARAVCQALGCTRLWLGGEVAPGIPWARLGDGRYPDLRVVTKAGGFGDDDSISYALEFLAGKIV